MTKNDIAKEVLTEFPDLPNRTATRKLMKDFPSIFVSYDATRTLVRSLRGAQGNRIRNLPCFQTEHRKPLGWQKDALPKSISEDRPDLVIKGKHKTLILSDIHIPYHDEVAVKAAVEYGKKQKPDIVILNGDIGDFYAVSRHDKDPRRCLAEEIDAVRQFLFWLRKQFPKARIIYKIGNHEDRMERFLVKNAPVLLGTSDFEIPKLLRFDDMKIECVGSLNLIRLGKLSIYHGHELPQGMSSPVNPARGMWMRVQETLLAGHWHRVSEHTEKTGISNRISSCWSTGCLCDMSPSYCIVNKWGHGFAIVETQADGEFEVHNRKIINGRVY
jgi:predicted phosphodiesterase